jgi:hypothetical protein
LPKTRTKKRFKKHVHAWLPWLGVCFVLGLLLPFAIEIWRKNTGLGPSESYNSIGSTMFWIGICAVTPVLTWLIIPKYFDRDTDE